MVKEMKKLRLHLDANKSFGEPGTLPLLPLGTQLRVRVVWEKIKDGWNGR